jgi:LytS/YehU family sensor histidine kinase
MASASLAKFSELLRHQLYECNDEQIPLSKEITYLENFIELEKLRQNPNLQVTVNIDEDYSSGIGIAPFILMTFVENAFKHVSKHKTEPNWINIDLTLTGMQLNFTVSNSAGKNGSRDVVNYGGIGLKNVQRRLDLVYPDQYRLDIQDNLNTFLIKLDLQLSAMTVNPSVQLISE